MTWPFIQTFKKLPFPLPMEVPYDLALIDQGISEKMFENNGHIHVYSPGAGAYNPIGPILFLKHKFGHFMQVFALND